MDGIATISCGHALIRCNRPELNVARSLLNLGTSFYQRNWSDCKAIQSTATGQWSDRAASMYLLPTPEVASPTIAPYNWKIAVSSRPHGRP
jgi:hypothetical protein